MTAVRRGVYFLANDGVLEQALAFLNSFRTYHPWTPLCLVPFAGDIDALRALRHQYEFEIFDDHAVLDRCDEIGYAFHGATSGQYRKLAIWHGPYDEFVYIDCDTVVLHNVHFVYRYLDDYSFVTSHSHQPEIRRWVWRDSIHDVGVLTDEQIAFAANTGFVASRRGNLSLAHAAARLPEALALAAHMELTCAEQPFLNYLIVTSGTPYTSLYTIAATTGAWDLPAERWAGDPSFVVHNGRIVEPAAPTLMLHWAGEWARARRENTTIPYHDLWSYYRHQ
ncbi:hypothetical protein O7623_08440 [Solwaraspora sp. WMMD791]|uniref:hypothetical protein n=1 Tax=Solwaraspora sp. WMMD791 TaxID=3016086 RepID=UPI00249A7C51|nr:hypothetical protein [Solwaraspora sp. WMMD791]WFE29199.1 hypothetical protein O7623_08440 [Solwaraspora sp. WMMD791]